MADGRLETARNSVPAGVYEALQSHIDADPQVFAEEHARFFARAWLMVGHRSQVAQPVDYLSCEAAGERAIETHATTTLIEDNPLVESVQTGMASRSFGQGTVMVDVENSDLSEHPAKAFQDDYSREMGL